MWPFPKITWEEVLNDETLLDKYVEQYTHILSPYNPGMNEFIAGSRGVRIRKEYAHAKEQMAEKNLSASDIPEPTFLQPRKTRKHI